LSYAPIATKYVGLELFGSWGGAVQWPRSASDNGLAWGAGDLKAGGKVSVPILPVLKLGGSASYTFRPREPDADWAVLDPSALPLADRLAWNALATLHFQDLVGSVPNFLFSYGKTASRLDPAGDETRYGAGVELQGRSFAIFVEGLSQQPNASSQGILDRQHGHVHVTPGLAIGNPASAFLRFGYTLSFGGDLLGTKQPNEIIVGFGLASPFGRRTPPQYGQIVGVVTDAGTGAPLAAAVAFPDRPKMAAVTADASTGIFKVMKAQSGAVTVEVSAEGYAKQVVPLSVENNKAATYEFKLRPLKTYGTIAGTVVDAATGAPMAARIEFIGSRLEPVDADPEAGAFRVDNVESGVYTLTASAQNYLKSTLPLAVEENKLAIATFRLTPISPTLSAPIVPGETAVVVTGTVYDKKTGTPLAAALMISSTGSVKLPTDAATGVYKTKLTPGTYTMVAEAKDYLQQTAELVVEKDRPALRDFALVKEGMALTLKGVYFNTGMATIKTGSRQALEDAAKTLRENPTIKVEIQGHTDSRGDEQANLELSENRAEAVVRYLVRNLGIDINRLTAEGYGESRPIGDNETAEGRALNRRVEFVITGQVKRE